VTKILSVIPFAFYPLQKRGWNIIICIVELAQRFHYVCQKLVIMAYQMKAAEIISVHYSKFAPYFKPAEQRKWCRSDYSNLKCYAVI
jgi:hypothetical protein